MSRVTNEMREHIVIQALKGKFADREEALEKARTALADALYEHAFGVEAAQARAVPRRWVQYVDSLHIHSAGWGRKYQGGVWQEGPERNLRLSKEQPLPFVVTDELSVDKHHPLWKQACAVVKEHVKIIDDRQALQKKIMNLLRSVNTFKQLREAWPEGEQFFPADAQARTALVPATLTHEINRMLGLEPSPKANPAKAAIAKAAS